MLNHFTAPRLATLASFFRTKTDSELLGCYAWNQAVAAGLFPLLGDFEVALRNALHTALSRYYDGQESSNWMLPYPNPENITNAGAPATLPSKHSMTAKTRKELIALDAKIKSRKGLKYVVTPDDIVASLHFGFWEVLIKGLEHSSHPERLQESILASVFPYVPATAATPYKQQVVNLLLRIRDVRNRIGHHDSLWTTPEFDEHGVVGFIPRRPRHTVNSLRQFSERLCWLSGWIDPEIPKYIQDSDHWGSLQILLGQEALNEYRASGGRQGTYQAVLARVALTEQAEEPAIEQNIYYF